MNVNVPYYMIQEGTTNIGCCQLPISLSRRERLHTIDNLRSITDGDSMSNGMSLHMQRIILTCLEILIPKVARSIRARSSVFDIKQLHDKIVYLDILKAIHN